MRRGWLSGLQVRFRRNESGVAAIEFSFLALPFFLTIFALVEIALVFAGELTLDNAVNRIGRELRTGQLQVARPTKDEFAKLVCDNVSFLLDCDELKIDLTVYDNYTSISPGMPPVPRYDLGGSRQIMTLTVNYEWPIFTHVLRLAVRDADGNHTMSGMAAFQTESF